MKVAVLQFLCTNCEYDTQYAFEKLGAKVQIVWHQNTNLPQNTQLLVIAGGFSYGDCLRSGAIAKVSPIMKAVVNFAQQGGLILGICNGFQILLEAGLLPGAMRHNDSLRFISKPSTLKIINNNNIFLKLFNPNDTVRIPCAHAEGNYYINKTGLSSLKKNNQILLTYCNEQGQEINFNGSVQSIAGICNAKRNIFGLMPHPERAMDKFCVSCDGIKMLQGFLSK